MTLHTYEIFMPTNTLYMISVTTLTFISFLFQNLGFVLRGTCINPVLYYNTPGCVSYTYWKSWDPLFVDQIESMFGMVR